MNTLALMAMEQSITATEMLPWIITMFIVGVIMVGIEMAMPGFGVFGIVGLLLFTIASILHFVNGGEFIVWVIIFIVSAVLIVAIFLILSRLVRKGKLGKSSIFNAPSSVPTDITEGTKDYAYLLGQVGTTTTLLRPIGRATFGQENVDVVARDGFIEKDSTVVVVQVEGQRVVVVENK